MSQSPSAITPRRPTALAASTLVLLALATALGLLVGWLATTQAEPDPRVFGALMPPLAISFAFAAFAGGFAWIHRREIGAAFDRYLPRSEGALRAVVLLIAALSGYETFRLYLFHFVGFWPTDLPSYHYASLAIRHGLDPYVLPNLKAPDPQVVFPYVYPPLLALLWTPLTYLPIEVVSAIWQILSLVALAASLVLCIRLANPVSAGARAAALVTALLLPLGLPSFVSAHHGAISPIFVFLLLLFFERLQRGHDRTAGAVLALTCGIKVLPVLLLPYLALKRRWRALIAAAAAGAFLLAVSVLVAGWRIHWEFLTRVAPQIGYATHSGLGFDAVYYPENQSLNGFLSRLFCPGGGCGLAIALVCLAAALPVAWRVSRRRAIDGAELALVSLVLLIVSPITWIHHLLLLILPAIVLAASVADGRWRPRAWWLAAAALVAIEAHDSGRVVIAVKGFVPWADQRLLMLLVLYAAFLHMEWRRTAAGRASSTAGSTLNPTRGPRAPARA